MKIYNANNDLLLEVDVEDTSYRYRAVMEVTSLTLRYSLPEHVEIPVGAYCEFETQRFTLYLPENFKMHHSRNFEYTVLMHTDEYKAKIWKFRNPVDGRLKFPLTAKPKEHLQMFVDNMNRRDTGWTVGDCIDGTETLINYDHDYCWDALSKQASQFETEFYVDGKRVSLRKIERNKNLPPLPLSYGKGNGFKSGVGRTNDGDMPPVEILFVQGGTDNIDRSKYGSAELLLPKNSTLRYDGEHFEGEDGFVAANARTYITDDLGFSIRRSDKQLTSHAEDSLDASQHYPKRIGKISKVVEVDKEKNFYDIVDAEIPKTLNYEDYLIEGETMTVIFQSGELSGKEFDVKYIHEAKSVNGVQKDARRFEIVPQEIDGITMPGGSFVPRKNDTYAVFHCFLPQAYINAYPAKEGAEWEMFKTGIKYLYEHEESKFSFTGTLDGIWAKKDWVNIGGRILVGAYILFSDTRFQPEGVKVRIVGVKDYINKPHSPEITLSNSVIATSVSTTLKELKSEEVTADENHNAAVQFTKRRFRDAKETMEMLEQALFDNFTNSIYPVAIQTMQTIVGDDSLQFIFTASITSDTAIADTVAYNQEQKVLTVGKSYLKHMTLGIDSMTSSNAVRDYKRWTVDAYASAKLTDPGKKYFLYAKCSKTNKTGSFILSEEAKKLDSDPNYYHLLVGILNSEYDGERSFAPLYGFTEILPGRVTTERVVSGDGQSYFDMLANAMKLGDKLTFNTNGDGLLRLFGTLVQSQSGVESPLGCYRGVYNSTYTYYKGDEVIYAIAGLYSLYRQISDTPCRGIAPTNSSYWEIQASAGTRAPFQSTVFRRTNTTPATPTGGTYDNPIPTSTPAWSDGIPKGEEKLWASTRIFSDTESSSWNTPRQMTDTATYDVEFSDTDKDPGTPTTNPSLWFDPDKDKNTKDFTKMLWRAEREKKNGEWSEWTIVRIKGEQGQPGVNGDYVSYVFKSSINKPDKPTGTAKIPSGWSDAPSATGRWWMSKATINGATDLALTEWSDPVQVTAEDGVDGAYTDFKYAKNTSMTSAPSIVKTDRNPSGWDDTPPPLGEGEYLWMSQCEINADNTRKGTWSTPVRISGEQGQPGVNGDNGAFYEFRYAKNGSTTEYPTMTAAMREQRNPTGWSTTQPDVGNLEYLWLTICKISGKNNGILSKWSVPIRITPYDGTDGLEGKHPALVFRGNYIATNTYYGTQYRVDAVKYGDTYYVARTDAGEFRGTLPTSTSKWNPFGASFESVATGLLLAENANIANLIFRNQRLESEAATNGIPNFFIDGLNNIASFAAGNVVFNRTEAKLGWIKIIGQELIGYDTSGMERLKITPNSLPAVGGHQATELLTPTNCDCQSGGTIRIAYDQGGTKAEGIDAQGDIYHYENRDDGNDQYEHSFWCSVDMNVPNSNVVLYLTDGQFGLSDLKDFQGKPLSSSNSPTVYSASASVSYVASNGTTTNIGSVNLLGNSPQITIPSAGKIRITFSIHVSTLHAPSTWTGKAYIAFQGFPVSTTALETIIGKDGIMAIYNGNYMRMHSSEGFSVKVGSYRFRLTSSGIQKSTNDGSSWTNL